MICNGNYALKTEQFSPETLICSNKSFACATKDVILTYNNGMHLSVRTLCVVHQIDSDLLIFVSPSQYTNGFGERSLIISAGGEALLFYLPSKCSLPVRNPRGMDL